jgi:integrase
MRNQKGCISIDRGCWSLRWRETVKMPEGEKRVMRFKSLGPVTAEHERRKDKTTGKIKVPKEIQVLADTILAPLASAPPVSLLYTIRELVENDYLPDVERTLKPSTSHCYQAIWQLHLKYKVGGLTVREFQRSDAFRLWSAIHRVNPKMGRNTLAHIRFFLSGVFEFALNRGLYVGENPCKADLPGGLAPTKAGGVYNIAEVGTILSLLRADIKAQAIVALAFGSGMRKGELSGLKWEDYESTDTGAVIHVRRSSWRGRVTAPKTESSANDVRIDQVYCDYIEAYRQSVGGVNSGFMFGVSAEKPLALDAFATHHIKAILRAARLTWRGWHAFRRGAITFAATQLNNGGLSSDGIEAGRILGRHSDSGVTLNSYIAASKQEKRIAAAGKQIAIETQRQATADMLGAGLKQARPN